MRNEAAFAVSGAIFGDYGVPPLSTHLLGSLFGIGLLSEGLLAWRTGIFQHSARTFTVLERNRCAKLQLGLPAGCLLVPISFLLSQI